MSAGLSAQVTVRRGAFVLDVDLQVAPGQVVAVLGPNGAGKSTLLRVVAGLLRVRDGLVAVDGRVWDDPAAGVFLTADQRRVGFVFQDYRLFPHLSVRDNVAFGPRAQGASPRVARQRADEVLAGLDLTPLAGRRPARLSGGQAQLVALARALACEPAVLLLDEPLAALDARTRVTTRNLLRRHLAAFGGPTLLVVHDPLDAMLLADRVVVVEQGRMVQQGTPVQIARHPATEYVARLVGLNLYAGALTDPASGTVLLDGGGVLHAAGGGPDDPPVQSLAAGARVLAAVQPNAISVYTHEPDAGSARNRWAGRVTALELLTDRVRLAVDGQIDASVDITPSALAELGLIEGTPVWLTVKATEVVAYPAAD